MGPLARLGRRQCSLRGRQPGLEIAGIELRQQLALLDPLVIVHQDLVNVPRHPRTDRHDMGLDKGVIRALI